MSKRVLILDTSVLCCWLQVPGKDEAGPVAALVYRHIWQQSVSDQYSRAQPGV